MIPRDQLVEIGNFAKPHGIKGEISAHFDFEIMPLVEGFGHLFVEIDGLMVPFFITALRPKGNETLLLTLKGIDSPEAAAALTNKPVYIEASLLPEDADEDGDGMFYLEDLVGYTLVSQDEEVGVITDYDDSTENLLFSVRRPDGSIVLVPASGDLVDDVDVESQRVYMSLPAGLFNL